MRISLFMMTTSGGISSGSNTVATVRSFFNCRSARNLSAPPSGAVRVEERLLGLFECQAGLLAVMLSFSGRANAQRRVFLFDEPMHRPEPAALALSRRAQELDEPIASGHSWISSRKSSEPDDTFFPVNSSIDGMVVFGSGLAKHAEYFG